MALDTYAVQPSAQQTSSSQSASASIPLENYTSLVAVLDVTAAAAAVTDTLDVSVQVQLLSTNWLDVIAFTQVLGDGGAIRHVGKIVTHGAEAMFNHATALSAGSVRNIIASNVRIAWTLAGGGADFTFSVTLYPA